MDRPLSDVFAPRPQICTGPAQFRGIDSQRFGYMFYAINPLIIADGQFDQECNSEPGLKDGGFRMIDDPRHPRFRAALDRLAELVHPQIFSGDNSETAESMVAEQLVGEFPDVDLGKVADAIERIAWAVVAVEEMKN